MVFYTISGVQIPLFPKMLLINKISDIINTLFYKYLNFFSINNYTFNNSTASLIKNEYFPIFVYFFVAILLSIIIVSASYLLVYQNPESEKLSAYECGFEPYEDARNKFDVKFYLIAMLFIIFDIETMFIIPWSLSVSKLNLLGFWSMVDFIIELGLGFFYVWWVGALDWD